MQQVWKGLFALSTMLSLLMPVPAPGQEATLRLFSDGGPASPYGAGAAAFAEEVIQRTGGRYRSEPILGLQAVGQVLGPNFAVGRGLLDAVRSGEADLGIMSAAPLGTYAASVLMLDVPFLFRDAQHARAELDGSVGQELLAKLPELGGVIGLAWSETGVRRLTNK